MAIRTTRLQRLLYAIKEETGLSSKNEKDSDYYAKLDITRRNADVQNDWFIVSKSSDV